MTIGDAHGLVGIVSVDHKCGRLMSLILGMRLEIMRVRSWSAQDYERRLTLLELIRFASERTPLHLDLFSCFVEHV